MLLYYAFEYVVTVKFNSYDLYRLEDKSRYGCICLSDVFLVSDHINRSSLLISENLTDELERIYRMAGSRKLWPDILTHIHTYCTVHTLFSLPVCYSIC